MIIPLVAFIALMVCIAVFIIIGIAITWHLFKYGIKGDASKVMAIIFIILSVILIVFSILAYVNVDWDAFATTF